MKYVALLRGINVGGNKKVPMATLKKVLEKAGCTEVKTLLNSGNVVFEIVDSKPDSVRKKLEAVIEKSFGFPVPAIIRTQSDLEGLKKLDPFKKITVTKDTRLYISFLGEKAVSKSGMKIPYVSPEKNFTILRVSDQEIISVLTLMPKLGTVDAMGILEKDYGKNMTTRNWNTVLKLVAL